MPTTHQTWAEASAVVVAAGFELVRNEWGSPTVLRAGVELEYDSVPASIRRAWTTLSIDDPAADDTTPPHVPR